MLVFITYTLYFTLPLSTPAYVGWESFPDCKENNWLTKSTLNQWTLNPTTSSTNANYVMYIYAMGNVGTNGVTAYDGIGVYPVIYLKSTVKILDDGSDGSMEKPFHLSL